MRIVIDCFKLVKGAGKSIGIYNLSVNLVKNLIKFKNETDDPNVKVADILIIGNKYNRKDFYYKGSEFITINNYDPLNKLHCVIWELFAVSVVCEKLKADSVLFPRGFCAFTHRIKDVVIIHDMIPFYYNEYYPGYFRKCENAYIMWRLRSSARTCNKIITISKASKNEIIKYCGVNENKIVVIYNGCNEINLNSNKEMISQVQKGELKKGKKYICALTSYLPHKNAKGIFETYKKYCELADDPMELVVIGVNKAIGVKLSNEINKKITYCGYIEDDRKLYQIIAEASVFLFLSYIEGFGFPPLEAMQLGVPVICSNRSSLPEVVGDAALLVDPDDYEDIASKIIEIENNYKLKEKLLKRAYSNVMDFCWDKSIKQYWKAMLK